MTIPAVRRQKHVVIVGGGISGLSAALWLRDHARHVRVSVVESSPRLGGKIRTEQTGHSVSEVGAESFLLRVPEAVDLVTRLGLGDDLVHPGAAKPAVAWNHDLHALPAKTLMGIPSDVDRLAASRLFTTSEIATVRAEVDQPGPLLGADVSLGALVRSRLGPAVAERLVDPLLGGVYAGVSDHLSTAATMPALFASLQRQPSLVRAAQEAMSATSMAGHPPAARQGQPQPIFGTVAGGLQRLVDAAARASGADLMLGEPARELRRSGDEWEVVLGNGRQSRVITADAVVIATPAPSAARLLSEVSTATATELGTIDYASVALVNFVFPHTALPPVSGALVPATTGRLVKAVTFTSNKWPHTVDGALLRASVGRFGDDKALMLDDETLVQRTRKEIVELTGPLPDRFEARVTRWADALPQYRPGHLERVRRTHDALAPHPTLALAGAAYHGVGIPACIRSGYDAARQVLEALEDRRAEEE